ncbi:cysteine-rich CWC family protein [Thermogymnomonas acidicola]|uniref:cysteine-rich CWC family protein n=1 Tax=Thermogymnomonas acidicola TaxID=399579 RepID=UPI0016673F41|nr:cysteine-rich CWC family protein [Thermogymnomonas acidicola]
MRKVCSLCLEEFECGGPSCWCSSVSVDEKVRSILPLLSGDCVCPRCLSRRL